MAKEKTIDAKKVKLRYDSNLSVEEIAVLALEENTTAIAHLLKKQEFLSSLKTLNLEINNQDKKAGELAEATLNILKQRLGASKYEKLCEKSRKEFKVFNKQMQQDQVNHLKKLEKDVIAFVKGVGEMQQAALKFKKGIYKITLTHKKDLQHLKAYSDEMRKIVDSFTEDDGASI